MENNKEGFWALLSYVESISDKERKLAREVERLSTCLKAVEIVLRTYGECDIALDMITKLEGEE